MQALYDVPAPAKLNLFLHIIGQRPDGYHLIQSAFMLVDWCDTLHFEHRSDGIVSREDLGMQLPTVDLTIRAARALKQATSCTQGVHMSVLKNIPVQAGMGGGSSDAATTLLALNRLWNLRLTLCDLEKIGLQIGADIPFFLRGSNAWVEGIGEQITPLVNENSVPAARFAIVKPTTGIETKAIFSSPALNRDSKQATILDFATMHFDFGRNDLEPVAKVMNPEVSQAIEWLDNHGTKSRMTGSGSAVFAKISCTMNFKQAPEGWKVKVCENLMTHPLSGWALKKD